MLNFFVVSFKDKIGILKKLSQKFVSFLYINIDKLKHYLK
jgi:hypothetical protein